MGEAKSVRYKDRACYRHQVCRVDLTSVFSSVRYTFRPYFIKRII